MLNLKTLIARAGFAATTLALAVPAFAQPVAAPDAPLSVVPAAQRLTLAGVFINAKPIVQLVLAGLVVAIAYAAFIYIRGLIARREARAAGPVFLAALAAGGPLIGLFGAAYGLLDSFIGMSNVRPAPSLGILAPGFAEAALCVCLGLLAGAIAVIGHRHLTGGAQAVAQTAAPAADPAPAHLARAIG